MQAIPPVLANEQGRGNNPSRAALQRCPSPSELPRLPYRITVGIPSPPARWPFSPVPRCARTSITAGRRSTRPTPLRRSTPSHTAAGAALSTLPGSARNVALPVTGSLGLSLRFRTQRHQKSRLGGANGALVYNDGVQQFVSA
jgi:hypothetical protein